MRKNVWRGLTATMAFFLIASIAGMSCLLQYKGSINSYFSMSPISEVSLNTGENIFVSEFGEFDEAGQKKLTEATIRQNILEAEEGSVLLRNERAALPLGAEEKSISVFGRASVDPVYRNHSAGNTPGKDAVTLKMALEEQGFEINPELWAAYEGCGVSRDLGTGNIGEAPASLYTPELCASWEDRYHDVALIFLTRESSEGSDLFISDADGISQLAFHQAERDMIELVTASKKFGKVIVLLNTPAPMELGWLAEYDIDACVWIGTPGREGFIGVVNLLTGKATPSGRLVDIYAANSLSAPAVIGSATETPTYVNSDKVNASLKDPAVNTNYYVIYQEGIYVGYKYYETRYEDCILNQGSAAGTAGSSGGTPWNYADEVVYPFGYGLSYTTFSQKLNGVKDLGDGTMEVSVTVKNTGTAEGKDTVQVYAQTPYGDYEKENLVEKSAVQIINYGKTSLLQPGQEETVNVTVDKYLLASYDYLKAKTYILSEGDYYLAIGSDSHDALNNILAAKGAQGLYGPDGEAAAGDAEKTYRWHEDFDPVTYSTSTTGYKVTNQFDDCNLNSYIDGAVTYLSRSNWEGTYPKGIVPVEATDSMIRILGGDLYTRPEGSPDASSIRQGVNRGISLLDMRGIPYNDVTWDTFLSQMTVEEMASQLIDGFGTKAVASVGKPAITTGDGIDSLDGKLPYGEKKSRPKCQTYTAQVVLASTWNKDLQLRRGQLMGEEAMFRKLICIFGIGGDLHRTPFGGRNFEYMSEDGTLAYQISTLIETGYQQKGVQGAIKHFSGNDQETRRQGVSTFFNEQAFRENNLRIFEGAVKVAGSHALMQGLHRLGCTYSPAHRGMNTEVLRNEWGFEGFAETDGTGGVKYQMNFADSLTAGTSVYCLDSTKASGPAIQAVIEENNDGYVLLALRRAVKDYFYAYINGSASNGLAKESTMEETQAPWESTVYMIVGILAFLTLICAAMLIWSKRKETTEKEVHA